MQSSSCSYFPSWQSIDAKTLGIEENVEWDEGGVDEEGEPRVLALPLWLL